MTILKDELSPTHRFATLHTHMPSEDIQNVLALSRAMEQSKHVFMPSLYVSEEDSYDSALALSKITQSILEERKRVIEEY